MTDFDIFLENMKGKRAAVLGLGVSNTPLIRILLDAGADVTICDKKDASFFSELLPEFEKRGAHFCLGGDYLDNLDQEIIFRSPGIRPDHPGILKALRNGSVLTSEMEAFLEVCPCKVAAVTGSDGKTTTSTLISKILEASGRRCFLGGNIGKPLLSETGNMTKDDFVVLELSSFQLMTMKKSPDVAVVTNVTPNHLDWHTSMDEYIVAKENVFKHQTASDAVVLNSDNDTTASFAKNAKGRVIMFSKQPLFNGVFMTDNGIVMRSDERNVPVVSFGDILIPGLHNKENYMAAAAACHALLDEDCFDAVRFVARTFKGVEHRIELVREKDGVRFYNDSIASSPTRTIAGLHSFDQKVILIAGGYDKHIPFEVLGPELSKHVKALFLTGQTSGKIYDALKGCPEYDPQSLPVTVTPKFDDAVKAAADSASGGDIVILSPACASFDAFRNFEERGRAFKNIVNLL